MSKIEDLNAKPGFTEELETVARAIAVAIAGAKPSAQNAQGSIEIEVSLSALILVAAGTIAKDLNLKTRRDVRVQAQEFGKMLCEMAVTDRDAGEAGEQQFLDLIGAGVAPGKSTKAVRRLARRASETALIGRGCHVQGLAVGQCIYEHGHTSEQEGT